ncbi:DUF5776 domain-containing protein [Lentilactobacillus hilgardii]|uniref:DUF5776 domain-containing protein n=1 Tax=Lentilactobacillus hilgardii TaxID=1588 RepID=UPI003FA5CAA7
MVTTINGQDGSVRHVANKPYPVTTISKNIKKLIWHVDIVNKSSKRIYIRNFSYLPVTNDRPPQYEDGPIFKMGTDSNGTYQDVLTPEKLGLNSTNWDPEDNPSFASTPTKDGVEYRIDGSYVASKDITPAPADVSGIALYGWIKPNQTIKMQIPVYLTNSNTVKSGVLNHFYDNLYQYRDDNFTVDPNAMNNIGSAFNVGTFDSNIQANSSTMTAGNKPSVDLFNVKGPNLADVKISKVTDPDGNDVTGKALNTIGTYKVTLSAPNYGDVTVNLNVIANGSTGGGSTVTSPATTSSSSSSATASSSSSSATTSSSSSTPTTTTKPSTSVGPNIAVKGEAVYATKKIALYKNTNFTKVNRIAWYPKQKRVNRPMFVVTGYKRTSNGTLRYKVRDVNHGRKTAGKTGYITASRKYVVPVYYASVPKSKKVTVIAKKGINTYKSANLTGKAKHYKNGVRLTVKKLVKHNLTTRYQLSNGNYITANKKLIIAGNY